MARLVTAIQTLPQQRTLEVEPSPVFILQAKSSYGISDLIAGVLLEEMRSLMEQHCFVFREDVFEALAVRISECEILYSPDNQDRPVGDSW